MSPEELLNINGNLKNDSALINTAKRIHKIFVDNHIIYTIIGGLAVVRNGALRTTLDIDILIEKKNWNIIKSILDKNNFKTEVNSAIDNINNITIDFLYSGDDWEMIIPLPKPDQVLEYDNELNANFINLYDLLKLKTAIYLKKKKEDGFEIAAKDLSDVVELLKFNKNKLNLQKISTFNSAIKKVIKKILKKI